MSPHSSGREGGVRGAEGGRRRCSSWSCAWPSWASEQARAAPASASIVVRAELNVLIVVVNARRRCCRGERHAERAHQKKSVFYICSRGPYVGRDLIGTSLRRMREPRPETCACGPERGAAAKVVYFWWMSALRSKGQHPRARGSCRVSNPRPSSQ
jgi:hypothetical protein